MLIGVDTHQRASASTTAVITAWQCAHLPVTSSYYIFLIHLPITPSCYIFLLHLSTTPSYYIFLVHLPITSKTPPEQKQRGVRGGSAPQISPREPIQKKDGPRWGLGGPRWAFIAPNGPYELQKTPPDCFLKRLPLSPGPPDTPSLARTSYQIPNSARIM